MSLPTAIRINSVPITQAFRLVERFPVDFGNFELFANTEIQKAFPLRALVTMHDGDDHRWMLFNASEDMSAPPLWLSWVDAYGIQQGPHPLGPQQGFQWVDDDVTARITAGVSTSWDGWMESQIRDDFGIDVTYTGEKGSAGSEFHLPEGLVLRREGVSLSGYRWLNAYLSKQLLRSRWRWFGAAPFGVDGKLRGRISGYSFTALNVHGVNAYDPGHFDANELYWGWVLTGDPAFLLALLHLWCHAMQHVPSFGDASLAENPRQNGWPLVVADLVLRATTQHAALFAGLRQQVAGFVRDHVRSSGQRFPIVDHYAIPEVYLVNGAEVAKGTPGAQKLLYTHTWHYAPEMLACQRLAESLPAIGEAELAAEVSAWADVLAVWANEELYTPSAYKPVATKWSATAGWRAYEAPPGVADWFAGALALRDDPGPLGQFLIDGLVTRYGGKVGSPYYYSFGLGMVPRQFGFDERLPLLPLVGGGSP